MNEIKIKICPECGKEETHYFGYCTFTCWKKHQPDHLQIKCYTCGANLESRCFSVVDGKCFCSLKCENLFNSEGEAKQQKLEFEKIKRMAGKLFVHIVSPNYCDLKKCWELAEDFCKFAKQKQKEGEK